VTADGRAPHVSIIIPVFNAGDWLGKALDSVAAQTWREFELVIVDDGSTDARTLALLDEAARRPGVALHRTENRGPSHARNLAIERARAEYILPLDADDWLAPTFLEKTVPLLDADPQLGVVYTWVGLVGSHHGVWKTGDFSVQALLTRCTIHVASLFRRQLWADAGGYDPGFVESCEDWDLWLGAAARGWRGRCVPEVLVYYRRGPSSRERRSRTPGISTRLMRTLVRKHRPLYEAHLEDAIAGMYEERSKVSLILERIYDHPAVRVLGRFRRLIGRVAVLP
jgi:glycosyltransferase involved in cell wall biosynthesis